MPVHGQREGRWRQGGKGSPSRQHRTITTRGCHHYRLLSSTGRTARRKGGPSPQRPRPPNPAAALAREKPIPTGEWSAAHERHTRRPPPTATNNWDGEGRTPLVVVAGHRQPTAAAARGCIHTTPPQLRLRPCELLACGRNSEPSFFGGSVLRIFLHRYL